ncbi:endoplasmic reticulum-based factor for assembly of V-ATPase-domain-containing protein [Rhexocercosporidium sp. MPI-PUGE-AT-0058]|nr:endoplasmic reticulum-based factor for assembly of V-ATPase-domain-containing protein [Rhexocercosporidium sp. MPI-PUGE-AT-0058]
MVLLTMTVTMVEALEKVRGLDRAIEGSEERNRPRDDDNSTRGNNNKRKSEDQTKAYTGNGAEGNIRNNYVLPGNNTGPGETRNDNAASEPTLSNPRIGNSISHGQVVAISQKMKAQKLQPCRLEDLLKGARVYVPPPPPKPEPTSEYKALMARLRREEEARNYERMTNPPPPMETFSQRFPAASAARAFASSHQNINASDPDDDGLTYADVDRQMALIFNILISIVACAVAIWIAAKWWNTPARLALSMTGSALVGVAEVVVYSGYLRRVSEAKGKEKVVKEVKEIVNTWVVGAGNDTDDAPEEIHVTIESKEDEMGPRARKRMKDLT